MVMEENIITERPLFDTNQNLLFRSMKRLLLKLSKLRYYEWLRSAVRILLT